MVTVRGGNRKHGEPEKGRRIVLGVCKATLRGEKITDHPKGFPLRKTNE